MNQYRHMIKKCLLVALCILILSSCYAKQSENIDHEEREESIIENGMLLENDYVEFKDQLSDNLNCDTFNEGYMDVFDYSEALYFKDFEEFKREVDYYLPIMKECNVIPTIYVLSHYNDELIWHEQKGIIRNPDILRDDNMDWYINTYLEYEKINENQESYKKLLSTKRAIYNALLVGYMTIGDIERVDFYSNEMIKLNELIQKDIESSFKE